MYRLGDRVVRHAAELHFPDQRVANRELDEPAAIEPFEEPVAGGPALLEQLGLERSTALPSDARRGTRIDRRTRSDPSPRDSRSCDGP
jgi:hypothetical protein